MRKQETNTLLLLGVVAVAGYFAFRSGGFLNKPAIAARIPTGGAPIPQFSNPNDTAIYPVDIPKPSDIGIYVPSLDPTGQSLQLF